MPMKACPACGQGFTPREPWQTHCPTHQRRRRQGPTQRSKNARRNARPALLARYTWTPCPLCGQTMTPDQALDVDHVVPVAAGGTDDPSNLRLTHAACNRARPRSQ